MEYGSSNAPSHFAFLLPAHCTLNNGGKHQERLQGHHCRCWYIRPYNCSSSFTTRGRLSNTRSTRKSRPCCRWKLWYMAKRSKNTRSDWVLGGYSENLQTAEACAYSTIGWLVAGIEQYIFIHLLRVSPWLSGPCSQDVDLLIDMVTTFSFLSDISSFACYMTISKINIRY